MQKTNELEKLQTSLKKMEEILRMSTILGGSVFIGGEIFKTAELKEFRADIKSQIAAVLSNKDYLDLVK